MLYTYKQNIFMIFGVVFLSIGSFLAYAFIADTIRYFNVYRTLNAVFSSPLFYLNILLLIAISTV